MKKGMNFAVLIFALIFLVLVIVIFFPLLSKTQEKAFEKVKSAVPDEKTSDVSPAVFEYFLGRQIFLPSDGTANEITAVGILEDLIMTCYASCKEKSEPLFCFYVDAHDLKYSIEFDQLQTFMSVDERAKALKFNPFVNLVSQIQRFGKESYYKHKGSRFEEVVWVTRKAEVCCNKDKVYMTTIGLEDYDCLDVAKGIVKEE